MNKIIKIINLFLLMFSIYKTNSAVLWVYNNTGYPVHVSIPHADSSFIKHGKQESFDSGFHKIKEIQWSYSIPQEKGLRTLSWSATSNISVTALLDQLILEPNGVAKLNGRALQTKSEIDRVIVANFN